MKLFTAEIEKRFAKYPIGSQEGKNKEAVAVAKFFLPEAAWTWYILEAEPKGDMLFGICIAGAGNAEYGYFSRKVLQSARSQLFGLPMERDKFFEPAKLEDIDDGYLQSFISKLC